MKTYKKVFIALWAVSVMLMALVGFQEVRKSADKASATKLSAVSDAITDYARAQKELPNSLDEIKNQDTSNLTYKKLTETSYELCTTFVTSIPGRVRSETQSQVYVYAHDSGYQCFKAEPTVLKTATRQTTSSGSVSVKARDTEREIDIKAIHAQLEAYYAQNGSYPTRAQLNNLNFRNVSMKGLETEWLKDPSGRTATLLAEPSPNNYYGYQATTSDGTACDNMTKMCGKYTLTAALESGSIYRKNSLN